MPLDRLAIATGAAAVIGKVALSWPRLGSETPLVVITWFTVLSFVVIGLALLRTTLPPANGWGCLLVALASVPGDLNVPEFADSSLSEIGFVLEPLYLPAAAALVLRYPSAKLARPRRWLVGALVVACVGTRLPMVLTSGRLPDGAHRAAGQAGPYVPFLHDWVLVRGGRAVVIVLLLAIAAMLLQRMFSVTGLARQSIAPLAVVGFVTTVAAAFDQAVWVIGIPEVRAVPAAMVRDLSASLIPVSLLADLLRRRTAGAAVTRDIVAAAGSSRRDAIEEALQAAFLDPSATFRAQPPDRGTAQGTEPITGPSTDDAALPPGRDRRQVTSTDGRTLFVIEYSTRAMADDELLETAVATIRLCAENRMLHDDLTATIEQLHDSRLRLVEAGLAERRRVERDLHDGAQQQFLGVAAQLATVDFVDDQSVRGVVREARSHLAAALEELRQLARGIHPAVLTQGGLTDALPPLCQSQPGEVFLSVDPQLMPRRPDAAVEAAAYFLVAEALTNVTRHAGATECLVDVSVEDVSLDGGGVRVTVSDNGRGAARVVEGGGLRGLRDRIETLGGVFAVHTDPCPEHPDGTGTVVMACLPMRVESRR